MSKPGKKPTPTKVLKMRGSWRADDRAGEPQPCTDKPICPARLSKDAKAVWKQIAGQLHDMGVLTKIDGNALVRYCDALARWWRMTDFLNEKGEMYSIKDDTGKVKYLQQFPQVAIYHKLGQTLSKLEAEFGLTPSARAGLSIERPVKPEKQGKGRFFGAS